VPKKGDDCALGRVRCEPEVRIRNDVAGSSEHARILPSPRALYKPINSDDLRPVTNHSTPSPSAPPYQDIEFRVRYAETDQMGVVYHANYLVWCEVGRTDFIRTRGMSYADVERAGIGLAVSELSARFHAPARYDELIRVRTTLGEVRSRRISFDYLITRAESGERLVTAHTSLVSIDSSTGKLTPMPPEIRELFAPK
jgi:acyl-CoA thioester hydrolase